MLARGVQGGGSGPRAAGESLVRIILEIQSNSLQGSPPCSRGSRIRLTTWRAGREAAGGTGEAPASLYFTAALVLDKQVSVSKQLRFCVHVLFSLKDQDLYTGFTTNLKQRLSAHFHIEVGATKNRRPLHLVYCEDHFSKVDAFRCGVRARVSRLRLVRLWRKSSSPRPMLPAPLIRVGSGF